MNTEGPGTSPTKSKWRCAGIGCGTLLLLTIIIIVIGAVSDTPDTNGTSSQTTATSVPAEPKASPKPANWQKVATFEGSGIKKTPMFTVGEEWKVVWDTKPGQIGEMNFQIFIYEKGNDLPDIAANVIGANKDESYQHKAGTYYLEINTAQPYVIEIWENQ